MSLLISVAIFFGVALWGYSCHSVCKARDRRFASQTEDSERRVIALVPLVFLVSAIVTRGVLG